MAGKLASSGPPAGGGQGVFACPRHMSTGKKNAQLANQTGTKARERAFFGAATPVRARGQGFREWGGNSNLKRNLSPSESDGLRFLLIFHSRNLLGRVGAGEPCRSLVGGMFGSRDDFVG